MRSTPLALAALCLLPASTALAEMPPSPFGERVEWTADIGPEAREHASVMTFGSTVVVYAGSGYSPQLSPLGDAWAYDPKAHTWTPLQTAGDLPTPGGSKRVAQAQGADHAYLFAGYGEGFACTNELHRVTLDHNTLRFERIEQVSPPPERALHAFGFDPHSRRFVAAMGVSPRGAVGDTWIGELNADGAVEWSPLGTTTAPSPSPRFGFPFAFDTDRGELVILSGQLSPTPEAPMAMTDELWALDLRADPPAWRQIELDSPPIGRRNPCFAFDDEHDRLAIWCGTADGRSNVSGLLTLHRDDAGEWALKATDDERDHAPPRRSSGFGFADPASDAMILGFGNSAEGRYTDWVTIHPTTGGE